MVTHQQPEISVLLAVYNGEQYLSDAIKSILRQSFKNFEFIIVDDASYDSSQGIIKSFTDHRILTMENEVNIGLAKSLNRALKRARGKYIVRIDADDIALPHRLQTQYQFMENNPEIKLCGSGCQLINELGQTIGNWEVPCWHQDISRAATEYNPFIHSSVIFNRQAALQLDGYPELLFSQDYALWVKMIRDYKVANLPEYLIELRQHSGQHSKKENNKRIQREIKRQISSAAALSLLEGKNFRTWQHQHIKTACQEWAEECSNNDIYLYGAGQHTQKNFADPELNFLKIKGIVDLSPKEDTCLGHPVIPLNKLLLSDNDKIIISSDTYFKEMEKSLRDIASKEQILSLYGSIE